MEDKSELPDKIFKDCQSCPRLHRCDEVAMVRGRIPRMSILGPARARAQERSVPGSSFQPGLRFLRIAAATTACP